MSAEFDLHLLASPPTWQPTLQLDGLAITKWFVPSVCQADCSLTPAPASKWGITLPLSRFPLLLCNYLSTYLPPCKVPDHQEKALVMFISLSLVLTHKKSSINACWGKKKASFFQMIGSLNVWECTPKWQGPLKLPQFTTNANMISSWLSTLRLFPFSTVKPSQLPLSHTRATSQCKHLHQEFLRAKRGGPTCRVHVGMCTVPVCTCLWIYPGSQITPDMLQSTVHRAKSLPRLSRASKNHCLHNRPFYNVPNYNWINYFCHSAEILKINISLSLN